MQAVGYISGARYGGNFVIPTAPTNPPEGGGDIPVAEGNVMGTRGTEGA
jgi:hypothetical protein